MKVKVKICGIRSLQSAETAVAEGANFIGFNFVSSSNRSIALESAQTIINQVKGKIKIVGVFQNTPSNVVNTVAKQLNLDYIQLHGDEDENYMKQIERPIIKRIRTTQKITSKQAQFFLIDRLQQGQGRMVDFALANDLAKKEKIFFAGGLTPENVVSVIEKVKPFAVDVAGGIETDGQEDLSKIKQFIKNSKGVNL